LTGAKLSAEDLKFQGIRQFELAEGSEDQWFLDLFHQSSSTRGIRV
jgi:hypothetical protein